ncbi:1-phosphatidylinositol 4,5-bisphosphate phosphodiesterase gamma-1-like [Ylistrum balloti]|uniref:1-phosphatidylinositol 4,5-bisphosphate phosphodiesterase gamma-1-like n=1 Tax=Ylistrum balloti TaxID=509963 RepID=UPI002905BEC0|nr:1-phosphatidylinositol 4,5-bisphosphate phosphodiesterase gamma-1-like [Ylistrum balloti]
MAVTNGPNCEIVDTLRNLERGLVVTIFFARRRPERRTLKVKLETRQLLWIKAQGGRPEGTVNLREVKEVRAKEKNSKDFDKWPDEARKADNNLCFIVIYGNNFKLKTLSVVASSPDDFKRWKSGLDWLEKSAKNAPYQHQLERWLRREFCLIDKAGSDVVTLKTMKAWMQRVNTKIPTNKLRERFQEIVEEGGKEELVFEQFALLFHRLVFIPVIITNYIEFYLDCPNRIVNPEKFQQFLKHEQKENFADNIVPVKEMMVKFLADPIRHKNNVYFTDMEFEDYLFSKDNSIWDEKHDKINQDMTQPLSMYWIASSHNTYLTGDQVSSDSSTEAYVRCLRMGCRCIELDCWDGPDGLPSIYHGHTLTTRIRFLDVLRSIKEHAWVASEYPLILSIENHCCLGQQRNMAMAFKDVFGADLLVEPVEGDPHQLPSPEKLKRKVILKHKKLDLPKDGGAAECVVDRVDETGREGDMNNAVKTGVLYLEDPFENIWHPHFFVLTSTKLHYTGETDQNQQEEDDGEDDNGSVTNEDRPQDELHFSERWFHGKLEGGRNKAVELLREYASLGDGAFLVRESETFVGDFSLSFWWQGTTQHCRIKSKQEMGSTKYFLIETTLFDSLYELITFYHTNPLRSQNFSAILSEPIPQLVSHERKEWFHNNLDRSQAEDMLKKIGRDGAFLVRRSVKNQDSYAISFRADGKIKHCRIQNEERLFVIGSAEFESLVDLVDYYEKNPLYNKVRLKYPVSQRLVEERGAVSTEVAEPGADYIYPNEFSKVPNMDENLGAEGIYHQPNEFVTKVKVKALYDYPANRTDELSFLKGAVITNVNKSDNGWWRGDYGDKKQAWFPDYMVEEIETQDESADTTPLGAMQKGSIDVQGCKIEPVSRPDRPFVVRIFTRTQNVPIEVAADNETEMKDWIENINMCTNNLVGTKQEDKRLERKKCLARDLSDLIIYTIAVPFEPQRVMNNPNCCEMSSFSETKMEKFFTQSQANFFVKYNRNQLSRVYPKGSRLESSNYDPVPCWNVGTQMVALNYQTPDRSIQLNQGRFLRNGNCGYVLQPQTMRIPVFNPYDKTTLQGVAPLTISITVIGARHLVKSGRGIASPFIEIEISGIEDDVHKFKTPTIADNGLNPVWKDNNFVVFDLRCPELALIRFVVQDEDTFGEPNFLGQATFPVPCIKSGYRSIPLKNGFGEDLEMAAILVHLEMRNPCESDDRDIYGCIQDLLETKSKLTGKLQELEQTGQSDFAIKSLQDELKQTEQVLLAKNEERRQRKMTVKQKKVIYRRTSAS